MPRYILFLTLLINGYSRIQACADYFPYNEEIRFRLFNPAMLCTCNFDRFRFTTQYFSATAPSAGCNDEVGEGARQNIALWQIQLKHRFSDKVLEEVFYRMGYDDIVNALSDNPFLKFVHLPANKQLKDYLMFMHQCTFLNSTMADPWERHEGYIFPQRDALIAEAENRLSQEKDSLMALRYAFLAIRLAAYNKNAEKVNAIYDKYFALRRTKNILDYWALYFVTEMEAPGAKRNLHAAIVFVNAPDKRNRVYDMYDKSLSLSETIALCSHKDDAAAVCLLDGVTNPGRAFNQIKQLHGYSPHHPGVELLINRELNKIEHWLLTPYYTGFSARFDYESIPIAIGDQAYAQQLLAWVEEVTAKDEEKFIVQRTYLCFLTHQYTHALKYANAAIRVYEENGGVALFLEKLNCLIQVAMHTSTDFELTKVDLSVIKQAIDQEDNRFLLAMAKELEVKKNYKASLLLFSHINKDQSNWENRVYWQTAEKFGSFFGGYYEAYFNYVDVKVNETVLHEWIHYIKQLNNKSETLPSWLYGQALKDLPRLYDLLGTKYMRLNKLKEALNCFEQVDPSLYTSSDYPFRTYLDANPFYTNAYQEHEHSKFDTIRYTKPQLVKQLLYYLKLANDSAQTNRDYYYYLSANCYFNMTQYGNSWMMRRYSWTMYPEETSYNDNIEYLECNLAKSYYLLASQHAHSVPFKALCLRMAGRCEKYKLYRALPDDEYAEEYQKLYQQVFYKNRYYQQLKTKYPNLYEEFFAYCESVDKYFLARQQQLSRR